MKKVNVKGYRMPDDEDLEGLDEQLQSVDDHPQKPTRP